MESPTGVQSSFVEARSYRRTVAAGASQLSLTDSTSCRDSTGTGLAASRNSAKTIGVSLAAATASVEMPAAVR
jgi:hypothetical protein